MIKAIETVYSGYRFRSRLEARWAVFFDALGIKWEYEKEGYDLDGIWYLPDFWLPEQNCWVEIKGQKPTDEENEKATRLARDTKKHVFVLWGDLQPFWHESIEIMRIEESKQLYEQEGQYHPISGLKYHGALGHAFLLRVFDDVYLSDTFYMFGECPMCHKIGISLWGIPKLAAVFGSENRCECLRGIEEQEFAKIPNHVFYASPRLIAAYTAARQARFEHGEKG